MSEGARVAADAAHRAGAGAARAVRVWRGLPSERRLAAGAAIGLFVTLFLPWYQETVIAKSAASGLRSASASVTGWGAFSFVEAAVLLVAIGVLTLLFQRGEGRAFHLPGGDGWVIMLAGGWACCLVIWRIFDKQGTTNSRLFAQTWGIEWGIFVALAVAALLTYAGSRIRAAHTPEPPLPGEPDYDDAFPVGDGMPAPAYATAGPRPSATRRRSSAAMEALSPDVRRSSRPSAPAPDRPPSRPADTAPERPSSPPAVRPPERPPSLPRSGERPPGWLTAPPERPAGGGEAGGVGDAPEGPPRTGETGSWSYRDVVGEDDALTSEWEVSDFRYSRSAPAHRLPEPRDPGDPGSAGPGDPESVGPSAGDDTVASRRDQDPTVADRRGEDATIADRRGEDATIAGRGSEDATIADRRGEDATAGDDETVRLRRPKR